MWFSRANSRATWCTRTAFKSLTSVQPTPRGTFLCITRTRKSSSTGIKQFDALNCITFKSHFPTRMKQNCCHSSRETSQKKGIWWRRGLVRLTHIGDVGALWTIESWCIITTSWTVFQRARFLSVTVSVDIRPESVWPVTSKTWASVSACLRRNVFTISLRSLPKIVTSGWT